MERSLTLLDSGIIDLRAIDRIIQSVIFFADSIAIRATYEVASPDTAKEIDRRVRILQEQGFLKLWAHEYEVDDAGRAGNPRSHNSARRPADLVLDKVELARNLGEMDEVMRTIREEAYRDVSEGHRPFRQGVGEIISLRSHLASLVISSELNQDGLMTNPATRTALAGSVRSDERFQSAVVREVLGLLHLGSLTRLSPDQILECRRHSLDFRALLDESLLAVARGSDPVLTPEATAKELAARYKAISSEYALPRLGHEIGGEVLWDVMGASLPASIFLKYGIKAFKWRKAASEVKPYLLLMHLERALQDDRTKVLRQ